MKSIFILVAAMVYSLSSYSQTTLEEYNYITKGYKIQIESGLDMKKGYRFEDLMEDEVTYSDKDKPYARKTIFKGLYRDGEKSPCAIMMIYHNTDTNSKNYICIPHFKSSMEIQEMHYRLSTNFQPEALKALVWGLSRCVGFFAQNN